jgi:hypothetical protein
VEFPTKYPDLFTGDDLPDCLSLNVISHVHVTITENKTKKIVSKLNLDSADCIYYFILLSLGAIHRVD